ncbi:MAG: Holliday junction helicase subunit RuvA [Deltaproteobacteria bacterium]|jgi:Holliday junction DNA helicase RuvA|nr:Holliday junction helicase subunit RuvA [Deltaproteobacteria bacterium]
MIAHLRGSLQSKSPRYLILDVNGVGYEVTVPLTTFYELPDLGNTVSFHIHTHVRENALQLYGFRSPQEKELFVRLMGVNGIGPRLAINILSGISAGELVATVRQEDVARLTVIPGVGRKTAERIIVELRDKLAGLDIPGESDLPARQQKGTAVLDDALSALLNLGYRRAVAQRAIDQACKILQRNITVENLLQECLRSLA